jgi:hypothetical protein
MTALNPNRQKFLARLGRKYTVQALRRMGPERRYPILLALLKQGYVRDTCKKVSQGCEPRLGADTLDDHTHHGTADAAS